MNTRTKRPINSGIKCPTPQLAGAFVLLLLLPGAAWGGGVVANCTEAELRAAMTGGGLVTFACDGTITLTSTITNQTHTVLDGNGRQVRISGDNAIRVFVVTTNVSLDILHLTIADGRGRMGGGILNLGGQVSLTDVQVLASTASYEAEAPSVVSAAGGGLFNQGGSVRATNCVFSGNRAQQLGGSSVDPSRTRGGALCNESGEVLLQNCSFVSNSVVGATGPFNIRGTAHEASGGALLNAGSLDAWHCTFAANTIVGGLGGGAGGAGGAATGGGVSNLGRMGLNDCSFLSNSVSGGLGGEGGSGFPGTPPSPGGPGGRGGDANGGALFNAGVATVADCSFTGNVGRGGNGGQGGVGAPSMGPPDKIGPGGAGGRGGEGGFGCGAVCDINALLVLTNCTVTANLGIKGDGGPGGAGGYGRPTGATGGAGAEGQVVGGLRSIGAIVMRTTLAANVPGGNCIGVLTDGGANSSSDVSCNFTNLAPPAAGPPGLPPFFLVHNFTGQELHYVDARPIGPLITSPDGRFFGVTTGNAWPGAGAVFKVNSNGTDSSFAVLHGFSYDPTYGPAGGLAQLGNVLYGTTVAGGQSNRGTIFKVNTDGTGYGILHHFGGGADGQQPSAGLVLSGSTLFGTTRFGGPPGNGTVFKIQTDGTGYALLKSFESGTNGGPDSELVLSETTLFGTTVGSGSPGGSTVYRLNTDGSGYAVLRYFNPTNGCWSRPAAGLAISGSTLFIATVAEWWGESGCGMIFKLNTDGSGYTVLKQFPSLDAPGRHAGLIFSEGNLYGTTRGDGGAASYGSVFTLKPDGSDYTVLRRFNGADGAGPNGNLLRLGNTLYGTTESGGYYTDGAYVQVASQVYYGAGVVFGISLSAPSIASLGQSRTVELGNDASFAVKAAGFPAPSYQWYFNGATPVPGGTGPTLKLSAVQFHQAGAYTVVLSSPLGAITSAPVLLNVIVPVERHQVPGIKLTGEAGSSLTVDGASTLNPVPNWSTLGSVNLTSTWQYWFDPTDALASQRFYRAWQTNSPTVVPVLAVDRIPAITLTGNLGSKVRVDGINQIGPTDAWFTLDTVTLTNTSQLFFDVTAPGQPARLYRLVSVP
jgi:uncharacterized repeat protein (TIGR03803 family)